MVRENLPRTWGQERGLTSLSRLKKVGVEEEAVAKGDVVSKGTTFTDRSIGSNGRGGLGSVSKGQRCMARDNADKEGS